MSMSGLGRRARRVVALTVVGLAAFAGCTAEGALPAAERVTVVQIEVPVRAPVWSDDAEAIYALTEDPARVVKIEPYDPESGAALAARTALSAPLEDVGENVVTSPSVRGAVYVPQPSLGRVLFLGLDELRRLGTFDAGPAPSYLAVDVGSQVLLALSEDGSTVTGVRLRDFSTLPPERVLAGRKAELDGPPRGRLIDYFVVGPRGVVHYKGAAGGVEKKGALPINGHVSATDPIKIERVYVAVEGTDRLLAVGVKPALDGLTVAAVARLGEPVEHVGADQLRVYAATRTKLVVLESNSFEGYQNDRFPLVETIDFRTAVQNPALEGAPLSGLAVGDERVYLTFKGEPYVVSIAKPGV